MANLIIESTSWSGSLLQKKKDHLTFRYLLVRTANSRLA